MAFYQISLRISGNFVRDVPNWLHYTPLVVAQIAAGLGDAGKNADGIKAALEYRDWIVPSVRDQSGWLGDYIFVVDAVVHDIYSESDVTRSIQGALADLFIVNGVTVLSSTRPTQTQVVPPATGSYTQTPTAQNPGSVYGYIPGGALNLNVPTPSTSDLFAGLSTTTIAIMAVALVVLARR